MPALTESPVVSQAEIARLFSKTPQTILAWKRGGCPVVEEGGRGKPCLMRVSDVAEWRERQAAMAASGDLSSVDLEEARRRKLVAEAATAELTLDERRGLVVEVAVVMDEVGRGLDACRARFLGIGSKIAPLLAMDDDAASCKRTVDDAVNEALHELSSPSFELPSGAEGDGSPGAEGDAGGAVHAAADAKPKRVGGRKPRPVG